jgi:hypothetical protein
MSSCFEALLMLSKWQHSDVNKRLELVCALDCFPRYFYKKQSRSDEPFVKRGKKLFRKKKSFYEKCDWVKDESQGTWETESTNHVFFVKFGSSSPFFSFHV